MPRRPVPVPPSFDEQLRAWNDEHLSLFHSPCVENFAQLLALGDNDKDLLSQYLERVRATRDYGSGGDSRANITRRVGDMLRLAAANPQFREQMMANIREGLESCGDRVLIVFNDLEILWKSYQEHMTEEQARSLAIGQGRYELVKKYARESASKRRLGDELNTSLVFTFPCETAWAFPSLLKGCSSQRSRR